MFDSLGSPDVENIPASTSSHSRAKEVNFMAVLKEVVSEMTDVKMFGLHLLDDLNIVKQITEMHRESEIKIMALLSEHFKKGGTE